MDDAIAPVVKKIGHNIAFEMGIRVALSFTGRLLLGYIGGLPATAISVNAAVAFALSALLEIPTGVIADIFGRIISVRLGYYCQIIANLCTFAAIAVFPVWPVGMWILIIIEGFFDALGNSLLSGAREATYQSIIERSSGGLTLADREKVRQRYLSLAEAHGRVMLVVFPLFVICSVLALHEYGGYGHFAMLLIVLGWIAIDRQFSGLVRLVPGAHERRRLVSTLVNEARQCLGLFQGGEQNFPVTVFCWMVNRFVYITVTCYVFLAVIKDRALWPTENPTLPVLLITTVFLMGRLSRSFVLPALARRCSNERLILLGATAQSVLAGIVLWYPTQGGQAYVIALALVVGLYDVLSGMVERPALGLALNAVPEIVRASFLSLMSAVVLVAQFFYSVRLTSLGVGVPSMSEIWLFVLFGGGMMSLASLRLRWLRRRAAFAT